MRIASEIQRSILPRTFPPFPEREDFEIYAETIPAREMGGDFYDFFLIDAERLGFVIADVSGRGVPAAHYLPYLLRDASRIDPLHSTRGMALGVLDTARFETRSALLRKGDTLFLYTDGITEAIDRDERMFSEGRLRAFLERTNGCSPSAMIQGLVSEVRNFAGGIPQYDDITALALRYLSRAS